LLDRTYSKAADLFNSPTSVLQGVEKDVFINLMRPVVHRDCNAIGGGFNVRDSQHNKVRWGFLANEPSKACRTSAAEAASAAIGFGIAGRDCCAVGAGWTNLLVSNTAEAGNYAGLVSWLW